MKLVIRSSETDRVLSCNGSLTLTRMVDARDGDDGFEGVMLHWMIADRAIRELGATPPEGGLPQPAVPKDYRLPVFSLWIVDWAIRHLRETIPETWSLMVEVEMEWEFDQWINRGHADIVALSPDATESIGIDWKSGRIPVDPADNNEQVASYESLIKLTWPSVKKGTFQIAQPRLVEEDGIERISTVVVEDMDALVESMDRRICAAIDNSMELNTGTKQCRWCIGCSCPAIQAEQKLMKLKLTPEILATIKRTPDDALLGDFVITGRLLSKPTDDAEAMLHERLDKTDAINAGCGTQITRKIQKGAYSWPRPVEALTAIHELLPSIESQAKVLTPSVTKLKDEIAHVMNIPKTGKAQITAEGIFDARIRPLVEQGERKILQFSL